MSKIIPFQLLISSLLLILSFPSAYSAPEIKPEVIELLRPKLNTERIAYFFGNVAVEMISVNFSPFEECRISNLHSIHDGQKIMRTLAVVDFQQPIHNRLKTVHQNICQGQAIGSSLKQEGWAIDKVPVYFGSVSLSPQVKSWMKEEKSCQAAVHIYKLHVFKDADPERIHYCTIIEVQSPQYLDEQWLKGLYHKEFDQFHICSEEAKLWIDPLNALIQDFPSPRL